MAEPECRHQPPCATPAVHRDAQRDDWRKALTAAARARRNTRGRRSCCGCGCGPGWCSCGGCCPAGTVRRPATGSGP